MAFYQNIYSNVIVTMSNKGRTQSAAGMMHIQCQSLQVKSEQTHFCIQYILMTKELMFTCSKL